MGKPESFDTKSAVFRDECETVCPRCGNSCEIYRDEYMPTQNYPDVKYFLASKCCDVVLELDPQNPAPEFWDIP